MKKFSLLLAVAFLTLPTFAESVSFDFGGASSPVQSPFTKLAYSLYDSSLGYGWQNAVSSGDRGAVGPSYLDRDFNRNIGGTGTFLLDAPNGSYDLTFRFWEQYTQGPFDVLAENATVLNDITVSGGAAPQIVSVQDVAVADGQLTVDFPTTSANWMINGLTVKPSSTLLFDFETLGAPTMLGWQKVTMNDTYSSAAGYGWNRVVDHTDRGTGNWRDSDLCRDLNGTAGSFLVDLENGQYEITLTVGDRYANSTGIDISAEGVLIADELVYNANEFVEVVSTVTVTDGQLNLNFANDDGSWVVNSLDITVVPEPATITLLGMGVLGFLKRK